MSPSSKPRRRDWSGAAAEGNTRIAAVGNAPMVRNNFLRTAAVKRMRMVELAAVPRGGVGARKPPLLAMGSSAGTDEKKKPTECCQNSF